jgi:hypothetical protein
MRLKMNIIFLNIITIAVFLSCSKEEQVKTEVEIFIKQVKNNEYIADSLPKFSPNEIPTLLNVANDFSLIAVFPINPVSSYAPTRLTVGECLLWTVEHIRLHFGAYSTCVGFPSFVPELRDITNINSINLNKEQLNEVYNLYCGWWNDNKSKDFENYRNINPLENSKYRWK